MASLLRFIGWIKILKLLLILHLQYDGAISLGSSSVCYKVDPFQYDFTTAVSLSVNKINNETLESSLKCQDQCQKLDFSYAAIQDASFCFCGTSVSGLISDSINCTSKCLDGSICGGSDPSGPTSTSQTMYFGSLPSNSFSIAIDADADSVLTNVLLTATVNASSSYYIDWGDGTMTKLNHSEHTYIISAYYLVTAYLVNTDISVSTYIRVHDKPLYTIDCPTLFEVNVSQDCFVNASRQGFDYYMNWNLTSPNTTESFLAEIPPEERGVYGSAYVTYDTFISYTTLEVGTLIIVPNTENQIGGQLFRLRYSFTKPGSIALYAITPKCSSGSYCGLSKSCSDSCMSPESNLECATEFCVGMGTCSNCPMTNGIDADNLDFTYLLTMEIITSSSFAFVPNNVFIPTGVQLAVGCAVSNDCPSGPVELKTRPLGPGEEMERRLYTSNMTIESFDIRHILLLVLRSDPIINLNTTILCTVASPVLVSDLPSTTYDESTEMYAYQGGKLQLDFGIFSRVANSPPIQNRSLICQERILNPVLEEVWIKYGEPFPYNIYFPQGSPLFSAINIDGDMFYNYMDTAHGGWNLQPNLIYAEEGLYNLTGNTTNALGYVLYSAAIHVVPPVTDTWIADFGCPCLDYDEGNRFTLKFPSASHPPWNATLTATLSNGDTLFPSELFDFGTFGNNGAAASLLINKTVVLPTGFYTVTIFLENEVSNTTIIINVTVVEAIRNISADIKWDSSGIIMNGMGAKKNMVLGNTTVFLLPNARTGKPEKWKIFINETGMEYEIDSWDNFTIEFPETGDYTVIISGYNSVQGWVDSPPIKIVVVDKIQGFSLSDDGVVKKPGEVKVIHGNFDIFTPLCCIMIDYGDGSTAELFGNEETCVNGYPGLPYKGPITEPPALMPHVYNEENVYTVRAVGFDKKVRMMKTLDVVVGEMPCGMPVVNIVDKASTVPEAADFMKSLQIIVRGEADYACNSTSKVVEFMRWWTIYEVDPDTEQELAVITVENVLSSWNYSQLVMTPAFLPIGTYKCIFTFKIKAHPVIYMQRNDYTFINVIPSPLRPILVTGSATKIKRSYGQFVNLKPILSYDPDYVGKEKDVDLIRTIWCRQLAPKPDPEIPLNPDGSHKVMKEYTIPTSDQVSQLRPGGSGGCFGVGLGVIKFPPTYEMNVDTLSMIYEIGQYEFFLEVKKDTRMASTSLIVDVVIEPTPALNIECSSTPGCEANVCSQTAQGLVINPTQRLALRGPCTDDCGYQLSYDWNITTVNGDPVDESSKVCATAQFSTEGSVIDMKATTCQETFLTSMNDPTLVMSPIFFTNNKAVTDFIFKVSAVTEDGYEGYTEILVRVNQPPAPGMCMLLRTTGKAMVDLFPVTCMNWIDPEGIGISSYTYYYWIETVSGPLKKIIAITGKSNFGLYLPVGELDLFVDVTDRLSAISTYPLGRVSVKLPANNLLELIAASNAISMLDHLGAIGDQTVLCMMIISLSSVRDNADSLPFDLENTANLTDEIWKQISSIADLNNQQLTVLLNAFDFSTLEQINAGVNALQSIFDGVFKKSYGPYTYDMQGRETAIAILQKMVNQIPNICIVSPFELVGYISLSMDAMSAIITGINGILASQGTVPPTDMVAAVNWDYDVDIELDMSIPLDLNTMISKNVYDTTQAKAKIHVDAIFQLGNSISKVVLNLCVVGESVKAHSPNGASTLISKIEETSFSGGLLIEAKENMNTSVIFPKNFCPSRNALSKTDCKEELGLTTVIWPCITHMYPSSSVALSQGSRIIDIRISLDGKEIQVSDTPGPVIINIPREASALAAPINVSVKDNIRISVPFVYHLFNVTDYDASFTIEIYPTQTLTNDKRLIILLDYEKMPTPSTYLVKILVKDLPINENNAYAYFVSSEENNNKTGRFFIAVAMLATTVDFNSNFTKDSFVPDFNLDYAIRTFTSGCYYFIFDDDRWTGSGLTVIKATSSLTTCATNHLTPFGFGFKTAANTFDFQYIFANVGFIDNLTMYLALILITVLYIIFMIWAYFQDRRDIKRRGVTPLPDNDSKDKYLYELTFFTGPDDQATTDSNIYVILSGECEETEVRRLPTAQQKLYRRFGVDSFVMATPRPLGPLLYLRVFHDNSGEPPLDGWQLQMVVVRDLQLREKYIFDTNTWLAFYRGEGKLDQTFIPYEGKEEKTFSDNMYIRSNKAANQDHMWMSIFVRPIGSRYSRKERVSVCFVFLYLSMLVDALWYNSTKDSRRNGFLDIGPFSLSLDNFVTGLCVSIMVYPVIYILILIFKRARPKNLKRCRALEAIEKQRQTQFEDEGVSSPDTESTIKVEIDEKKEILAKDTNFVKCIPWWTRIIGWIIILASMGASIFIVWSLAIMWGEIKTVKWFSSFILSFFFSIVITQWLKVAIYGLISTTCFKSDLTAEDVDCDEELPSLKSNEEWQDPKYIDPTYRKRVHRVIGVDIENPETESIKERLTKEYQIMIVLKTVISYCIFLTIVFVLVNGRTDYNGFLLQNHLTNTFIRNDAQPFDTMKTTSQWWLWAKSVILQELRAQRDYNNNPPYGLKGFLNDRANRIIGYALIRQIRNKRYICQAPSPMDTVIEHCSGIRGLFYEDDKDFCAGWTINETFSRACEWEEYKHKIAEELQTFPLDGRLGTYSGGGYIIRLSGNQNDLIARLDALQQNRWIDRSTRAVILEFSVYNANVNLFCICQIVAEFNEGGGVVPKWRFDPIRLIKEPGFKGTITTVCELGFVVATVLFTIRELIEMKQLQMKYFSSYWNLAELAIIIVSYAAIGLYLSRYMLTEKAIVVFNETEGNGYVRMDSAALVDQIFMYACASIIFFSTLKLIKLLQFNKRMDVLALTIKRCWEDLKMFFIAFGIVFFAFSCLFFFMFTAFLQEFSRLIPTIQTSFAMMLGKFDFQAMKEVNYYSPILFFVFSLLNAMILVNVMLTIILQAFSEIGEELAKQDNPLNVIDFVWTSFRRIIRTEQLPKINIQVDLNDKMEKLSDRPLEDKNAEQLPDKVSSLVRYINDMYFDGRLDLNDPYAKRALMGGTVPKILPFQDLTTFGKRKILNSEDD